MRKQLQQNADSKKLGRREFLGKSAGAVVIGAGILGGAGRALAETLPTMGTPDWKSLKPGAHDTDLYTETTGYDKNTKLTWWPGRNVAGVTIGIIQFRANLPMMPGNMGNATTFDFPLLYRELVAENIYDIMAEQPTKAFTDATVEAAKWLELQGVRAIIGACGFFGSYQKVVQARINTPFFSSSLMQLPMIVQSMPRNKKVGVLTANGPLLKKCPAIENCGLSRKDQNDRILIEGLEAGDEFQNVMQLTGTLNPAKLEKEIIAGAKRLVRKDKNIGAILLECTELSPHAFAVQEAVRIPIWDYTTMTNWIHSGCVRRPFTGHI
jgi:Asp/Glu/hydantoin racemase